MRKKVKVTDKFLLSLFERAEVSHQGMLTLAEYGRIAATTAWKLASRLYKIKFDDDTIGRFNGKDKTIEWDEPETVCVEKKP